MKFRTYAAAMVLWVTPVALQAQSATAERPVQADQPTRTEQTTPNDQTSSHARSLRDQLMPVNRALLVPAPASEEVSLTDPPVIAVAARRSGGAPYMIVGGALFVAGLIAGGDGGTVLILAGAGIGAYGLYLYLQ